ncbi:MAG: phosphotransferase [Nitrospinota bacterium]|nr:phosphotransferase [Nitrospinota bacterium]
MAGQVVSFAERVSGKGAPLVNQLAGDASTRRYFRARFDDDSTVVVMAAPDSADVDKFIAMTTLMRELGADVPRLVRHDDALLAMEDLGDTMLQGSLAGMTMDQKRVEYHAIIEKLILFQSAARARKDKSMECFSLKFDEEKLGFEIDFADTHFLKGYLGAAPPQADMDEMKRHWAKVIGDLAGEMETLAHRDFHSRNIMVAGDRRVWIDYQDARMGRMQYDLASLLIDPYVDLGQKLEMELAEYYFDLQDAEGAAPRSRAPWSRDRFLELYHLSAAQRLYKALGTYGYQATVRKTDVYLPYIKPAARRLARTMETIAPLAPLSRLLCPYFSTALEAYPGS